MTNGDTAGRPAEGLRHHKIAAAPPVTSASAYSCSVIPRQRGRGLTPGAPAVTNVFGIAEKTGGAGDADVAHVQDVSASGLTGHEQVVFCQDAPTGLRAIIAIYSTALGPALGGTRFYPYQSEDAALADVLN